jgi:hypothetical protein
MEELTLGVNQLCASSEVSLSVILYVNPSNHSDTYTHPMIYHTKTLHSAHTAYLCVSYGSHNKQRLFPQTVFNRLGFVVET